MPRPCQRGSSRKLAEAATSSPRLSGESSVRTNVAAMRVITVEFPGYKSLMHYSDQAGKLLYLNDLQLYAQAITKVFLANLLVEE